ASRAAPGWRGYRLLKRYVIVSLQSLGCHLEDPTEDQRGKKSDREQNHNGARQPIRSAEHRQHRARDLSQQPRADEIQPRETDDVAAFKLGEEIVDSHCYVVGLRIKRRGISEIIEVCI